MILQSKRIWAVNTWIKAQITIENGRIERIDAYNARTPDMDYENKRIIPGLIDIHTHGAYGFDTNDAKPDGLRHWTKNVVKEGVTAFCPTTITQSESVLTNAVANVAAVAGSGYEGAEILGIHFEGPYLDQTYKGAQPEEYCVPADVEQFKRYQAAAKGMIRIITMACEHDTDFALTRYCVQHGVAVSQGHSGASYEQACAAIANGASGMTHVFNGMAPFHHRQPGLVGAAFRFRNVYSEVIGDARHSTPAALYNFFQAKGADSGILITDSLRVKGLPAGTKALFGGHWIELFEDGSAHLVEAGNLAGSTLRMNEGLRILTEEAQVPWQSAINACTINPARYLHIDGRKGSIQAGKDADLVVLNDDYSVLCTYVKGQEM